METNNEYSRDLAQVESLEFNRSDKVGDLLYQLHCALQEIAEPAEQKRIRVMTGWMKTALTLWGVPNDKIGQRLVEELRKGNTPDPEMLFLIDLLDNVPSEEENAIIAAYEPTIKNGEYEGLVKNNGKYELKLKELLADETFQRHCKRFNELFPFEEYQSEKGIMRRTMLPERNLRTDWTINWSDKKKKHQLFLDAICHRHHLYGFEKGQPLLLKLTVNPTPHGLMIFIPAYWSFDPWRDIDWPGILALLRARGMQRQGAKMSESRLQRMEARKLAYTFYLQATEDGLTGKARWEYIRDELGLPKQQDLRAVRELVSKGRELITGEVRKPRVKKLKK